MLAVTCDEADGGGATREGLGYAAWPKKNMESSRNRVAKKICSRKARKLSLKKARNRTRML
jgi:hypothetical protein